MTLHLSVARFYMAEEGSTMLDVTANLTMQNNCRVSDMPEVSAACATMMCTSRPATGFMLGCEHLCTL